MAYRKPTSEEKINARLREVTADLRRLRTALQDQLSIPQAKTLAPPRGEQWAEVPRRRGTKGKTKG